MDIDITFGGRSLPIKVENPHRMDTGAVVGRIGEFLAEDNVPSDGLYLEELLPRMVKGIAGCERGCPADAQSFVRKGFRQYNLEYIEGGILQARCEAAAGGVLEIRMFPEF